MDILDLRRRIMGVNMKRSVTVEFDWDVSEGTYVLYGGKQYRDSFECKNGEVITCVMAPFSHKFCFIYLNEERVESGLTGIQHKITVKNNVHVKASGTRMDITTE